MSFLNKAWGETIKTRYLIQLGKGGDREGAFKLCPLLARKETNQVVSLQQRTALRVGGQAAPLVILATTAANGTTIVLSCVPVLVLVPVIVQVVVQVVICVDVRVDVVVHVVGIIIAACRAGIA